VCNKGGTSCFRWSKVKRTAPTIESGHFLSLFTSLSLFYTDLIPVRCPTVKCSLISMELRRGNWTQILLFWFSNLLALLYWQEIDMLRQLSHQNIVQYYGSELVSFMELWYLNTIWFFTSIFLVVLIHYFPLILLPFLWTFFQLFSNEVPFISRKDFWL
jgi:hypothetical protein